MPSLSTHFSFIKKKTKNKKQKQIQNQKQKLSIPRHIKVNNPTQGLYIINFLHFSDHKFYS